MQAQISWSELFRSRQAVAARFGKIFSLPIARRVREVLLRHVPDQSQVLEVGAGDRHLGRVLTESRRGIAYESMDPDPRGTHDYRLLEDIQKQYDCVFSFEVIEHLKIEEIGPWLAQLAALLKPGGRLLLTTPNTFYPPDFLRDATHRTPLCYDELGGLVEMAGLSVQRIYRIYHDPLHRKLLRRYLFGWLFRLIGIDFARQIMLVAVKPAG